MIFYQVYKLYEAHTFFNYISTDKLSEADIFFNDIYCFVKFLQHIPKLWNIQGSFHYCIEHLTMRLCHASKVQDLCLEFCGYFEISYFSLNTATQPSTKYENGVIIQVPVSSVWDWVQLTVRKYILAGSFHLLYYYLPAIYIAHLWN